jgi:hypothetical protein
MLKASTTGTQEPLVVLDFTKDWRFRIVVAKLTITLELVRLFEEFARAVTEEDLMVVAHASTTGTQEPLVVLDFTKDWRFRKNGFAPYGKGFYDRRALRHLRQVAAVALVEPGPRLLAEQAKDPCRDQRLALPEERLRSLRQGFLRRRADPRTGTARR